MMEDLIDCLQESDRSLVKLFFVKKSKDKHTGESLFTILKTGITPEMGEEFKEIGLSQIKDKLEKNPEFIEYGVLLSSDSEIVEHLDIYEVPSLPEIIDNIFQSEHDLVTEQDLEHIWGYIVRIEHENEAVLLIKKFTPKKLLQKGKFACSFREGQFNKLDPQVITIDISYDAMFYLRAVEEERTIDQDPPIYIFNRSQFESFFGFVEVYKKEIESETEYITRKGVVNDIGQLVTFCEADGRKIKKLARLLKTRQLDTINPAKMRTIADYYHLDVQFDSGGKLIVEEKNIWTILRILNDDYLKSEMTDFRYESRSKLKK